MIARTVAAFAFAAVFATSLAVARADSLSPAALHALIASTPQIKPYTVPGDKEHAYYTIGDQVGFFDPDSTWTGTLQNGQYTQVAALESGGSIGALLLLVWTKYDGSNHFVGYIPASAGHISAAFAGGRLVVKNPIYAANEPNCCPGHMQTDTYTLDHIKLRKLSSVYRKRSL